MTKVVWECYQGFVKRFSANRLVKKQSGCILAVMKFYLIFFLSIGLLDVSAQQITVTATDSQPLKADAFAGYDNFGFAYFVRDNVLHKVKGATDLQYKNLALGKITRVDIKNPLQVVLFYEAFNSAVLLDNQLNETQRINFSDNPVSIVASAVGMASQNRLWVYNSLSQKVGLLDYLRNEYREITVPFNGKIVLYESDFNYFYWIDETGNRYATDIYGKVTAYEKLPAFDLFKIIDDRWSLVSAEGKTYAFDSKNNKKYELRLNEKTIKSLHYQAQILSIFTDQGITNYKITLP